MAPTLICVLRLLFLLALLGFCSVMASAEYKAFACLNSVNSQKETLLACGKAEGIEISSIEVGQSSNASCISDHCPLGPLTTDNSYYKHVYSSCHHFSTCNLTSTTLGSMSNDANFSLCGITHKARNTVAVVYRCVDVGGTPSTQPTTISPIRSQTTTSKGNNIWATTTPWESHSTDMAKQHGEKDDNLVVKIVAPILGLLTLMSMIVLVVCLKSNLLKRPRHESVQSDQSANYEDIVTQDGAYYSEPRNETSADWPTQDTAPGAPLDHTDSKPTYSVRNHESLTDDGFYDTVSDDNTYSLAEPVTLDRRGQLKVNKQNAKDLQLLPAASFSQQTADNQTSVVVVDSSQLPLAERDDNSTITGIANELYSIANPVNADECIEEVIEQPVLITNVIYEQATPMHVEQTTPMHVAKAEAGCPSEPEVGELIDNDIYGSN